MTTPSPEKEEITVRSPVTCKSSTRATEVPLVTTASLRAVSENTRRPSRRTVMSSIIRFSMVYFPAVRRLSTDSSCCSSSAIKPTLPRLMPSTGIWWALASRAAWRMVPSPPKHTSTSVSSSSALICPKGWWAGRWTRLESSRSKGRQMTTLAPLSSKIRLAVMAVLSPRSR